MIDQAQMIEAIKEVVKQVNGDEPGLVTGFALVVEYSTFDRLPSLIWLAANGDGTELPPWRAQGLMSYAAHLASIQSFGHSDLEEL